MSDLGRGGHASDKKKILVVCDSYLPSVQGGGGVWTVVNLVERFSDRYDFFIVTRNYDGKGDRRPFTTVETGKWNTVGGASVYYLAAEDVTQTMLARIVEGVGADCIFLNSTMSTPCVKFLMTRRRGAQTNIPVILAPCGELSPGALKGKSLKKKAFLATARATGLFDDVIWRASSDVEADEIRRSAGSSAEIMVAPDLTPKTILPNYSPDTKPEKRNGEVTFIFYSRVVPKKNLRGLLDLLQTVERGKVTLEIVGPLEDQRCWLDCQSLIATLPSNIAVNVVGPATYEAGLQHLYSSHFLVLPTLGENFGYVFIESLAAGTPVLRSDKVIWDDLEQKNAGWRVALDDRDTWLRQIADCIEIDDADYKAMSAAARKYAVDWLAQPEIEEATANLLAGSLGTEPQ